MRRARITALALALVLFAGAAPAQAQLRLDVAKKAAAVAIDRRLAVLRDLIAVARATITVTADRDALIGQLQKQVDGLTALGAKIQADTSESSVRDDAGKIVTEFRVYVITVPKAREVIASHLILGAVDRLTKLADRLNKVAADAVEKAIAAGGKGKDVVKAKGEIGEMGKKLLHANLIVAPVPATVLGVTPAGYPDTRKTLEQARDTLRTGRSDLNDALELARKAASDLK